MVDNLNDNERLPLLGATGEAPESSNNRQDVKNNSDSSINFSMTTQNVDGRVYTICKVCGNNIDITDKTDTFVVKCAKCGEATPVKRAPSKKRYVRCSCNCLLICFETANRIVCPRPNCKKIIDLPAKKRRSDDEIPAAARQVPQLQTHSPPPSEADFNCYVNCGHCMHRFSFNVLSNQLATCPSCKRTSSIGHSFANTRGIIFIVLFIIFVAIAINLSIRTKNYPSSISLTFAILLYLISIIFLGRSIYFFTLKVSEVSVPNSIA